MLHPGRISPKEIMLQDNSIVCGDCVTLLRAEHEARGAFADLIFADPPFNIGYEYDSYNDHVDHDQYVKWTKDWMAVCVNVLRDHGSFWIAIGDDYAADIRIIARDLGLSMRNWIIWRYTFGQSTTKKFARCHTHILYFVKNEKKFIFNADDIRVPSARQLTYNDKRANPKGKVPDDVWDFSRVCGTFRERVGWHPCQMPEAVLDRIIRTASNPGDLILDPFMGSGTTAVVADRLDRKFIGIDISEDYVKGALERLVQDRDERQKGGDPNGQAKIKLGLQ